MLPLWVLVGFFTAELILFLLMKLLAVVGVTFGAFNASVLSSIVAVIGYGLTFVIVTGVPWLLWKRPTLLRDVGLQRLPSWAEISLAPVGFVLYFLASALLVVVVHALFPAFDISQAQEVGFDHLSQRYEYLLAFATLVVIAPFAEEALFRGYLYGRLRRVAPVWLAIVLTSVLFGAIHGQWNVGLDVFALSIIACTLREVTGSIWGGVLLHMIKNGIAFYILFINTTYLVY